MKKNIGRILIIAGLLAFADQLSKNYAIGYLNTTENTGIAFGLKIPFLIILCSTVILLFVVLYFAQKELDLKKGVSRISIAMILGGGMGNLIDRITRGFVVDFISIWIWPTFNVADIFITLGILLIIAFYAKIKKV